jgi:hypothetical protein
MKIFFFKESSQLGQGRGVRIDRVKQTNSWAIELDLTDSLQGVTLHAGEELELKIVVTNKDEIESELDTFIIIPLEDRILAAGSLSFPCHVRAKYWDVVYDQDLIDVFIEWDRGYISNDQDAGEKSAAKKEATIRARLIWSGYPNIIESGNHYHVDGNTVNDWYDLYLALGDCLGSRAFFGLGLDSLDNLLNDTVRDRSPEYDVSITVSGVGKVNEAVGIEYWNSVVDLFRNHGISVITTSASLTPKSENT